MSIRIKIVLIVVPLLVVALVIGGVSSYFSATTGITRVTVEFLDFKTAELEKYVESQWRLLVENDLSGRDDMVNAAKAGIEVFARSIIRSESEVIFAVNSEGVLELSTADLALEPAEVEAIRGRAALQARELWNTRLGGVERVTMSFPFEPFGWFFLVTQEREAFYRDVNQITTNTLILVIVGIVVSVGLLLFFVQFITRPLTRVVTAMERIITTSDMSGRVEVNYRDEIGRMSRTFNVMIEELEKAYNRIKRYAFDAVLAQKREQKVRSIFQKYVPQELIDRFFANPESMLVGENRVLGVLFSDIRSFTSISELMKPDELVESLNRYFSVMVDIIMNRGGIVDKYIGDAIMAFFGAPVAHDNDGLQSVLAGIEMAEAVEGFNATQKSLGKPEFKIGVGINYGTVTVGNIGTEKKMDYTVIGDMVNVASRLEGLTKRYHQGILITEMAWEVVKNDLKGRLIDSVAVKGRAAGLKIYTVKKTLDAQTERGWTLHNQAMELYYARSFTEAGKAFREVHTILPGDDVAKAMAERCDEMAANPPGPDWNGVEIMETK